MKVVVKMASEQHQTKIKLAPMSRLIRNDIKSTAHAKHRIDVKTRWDITSHVGVRQAGVLVRAILCQPYEWRLLSLLRVSWAECVDDDAAAGFVWFWCCFPLCVFRRPGCIRIAAGRAMSENGVPGQHWVWVTIGDGSGDNPLPLCTVCGTGVPASLHW